MPDVFDEIHSSTPAASGDVFDQIHSQSRDYSVGGFARNAANSGLDLAKNIGEAVVHPIDTAAAAGKTMLGTVQEMSPVSSPANEGYKPYAEAFGNALKSRYGGGDKILNTLYSDPVGFLADAATLLGGAGGAARGFEMAADAAKAARIADAAGAVARTASAVSDAIDPVRLAGKTAGKLADTVGLRSSVPEALYQSALKPPPASPDVRAMVRTGLNNAIPISEGGTRKLDSLLSDVQQKVNATIAARPGVTIDPNSVAQRVDQIRPTFSLQVNPTKDLKTLDAAKDDFLNTVGAGPIPADQAQAIKVNTYKQLTGKYGELKNAEIEAQKALARGIKEELNTAFPELANLNEKESNLLGLQDVLERTVRKIGNHDLMGISTPLASAGAAALTGNPAAAKAAAILNAVIGNANVKSRLAIALDYANRPAGSARKVASTVTVPLLSQYGSRIQSYLDSLSAMSPSEQSAVFAQ
jgi:hypothetical protein